VPARGHASDAFQHREILLMLDVPVKEVARVEKLVHRHHPVAVAGGVGWHSDALRRDCLNTASRSGDRSYT